MTSSTRGSMGVVDWLSMKIGNLGGIVSLLRRGGQLGHGHESVRSELVQRHGVEQPADAGLDFLNRPAQVAARILRAAVPVGDAADDLDGALDSPDHLSDGDIGGLARQHVSTLWPVVARDELVLGETLEDLGEQLARNVELLRDALGAHRALVTVGGDIVHRHQPVVSPLCEPQHAVSPSSLCTTKAISDTSSRSFAPTQPIVKS